MARGRRLACRVVKGMGRKGRRRKPPRQPRYLMDYVRLTPFLGPIAEAVGCGSAPLEAPSDQLEVDGDVAPRGVGVGADLVGGIDKCLGCLTLHAWQRDPQCHGDAEPLRDGADADV